jgi:hypothetical protein
MPTRVSPAGGFVMSKIRLSMFAYVQFGNFAAGASLVLDTQTQTFSDISVTSNAGVIAPNVWNAQFTPAHWKYPQGMPLIINIGTEGGLTLQMNYQDHGDTSPAIPMDGGFVEGIPFDILGIAEGMGGTGWVAVTQVR